MRHDLLDDVATLPGEHPGWCARDHRCDAQLGGKHRSIPEEWRMPVGYLVVWREARPGRRGHVVWQWSMPVTGDEAAFADDQRRALVAMQRSLLDSTGP